MNESEVMMFQSVAALLHRVIDYAGLFPPAALDMPATLRNYAAYRNSEDSWMLGRLIVPVSALDEFEQAASDLLPRGDDQDPWPLIALGSGVDRFDDEIERIERFNLEHEDDGGRAFIEVIELKVEVPDAVDRLASRLPPDLLLFIETPLGPNLPGLIDAIADADAGAKVRTGGVAPAAPPSPQQLANFIAACAGADVPFKATAGLHHPLSRPTDSGAIEFGFLNLLIAASLAQSHELDEAALQEILQESAIDAFQIEDDVIAWQGNQIKTASIEDVRECFARSFGSCSFEEPRDDLRALNLL